MSAETGSCLAHDALLGDSGDSVRESLVPRREAAAGAVGVARTRPGGSEEGIGRIDSGDG
jgi:hypothetical protein